MSDRCIAIATGGGMIIIHDETPRVFVPFNVPAPCAIEDVHRAAVELQKRLTLAELEVSREWAAMVKPLEMGTPKAPEAP